MKPEPFAKKYVKKAEEDELLILAKIRNSKDWQKFVETCRCMHAAKFQELCSKETRKRIIKVSKEMAQKYDFDASDIVRLIFWDFLSFPRKIRKFIEKAVEGKKRT